MMTTNSFFRRNRNALRVARKSINQHSNWTNTQFDSSSDEET